MANKMASTRNRRLMRTWFVLTLLIFVLPSASRCDTCQKPDMPKSVSENVPKGTMLLKIKYTQSQTWKFLKGVPDGYFDLTKGNTSYYLIAAKKLDYEELKEKGDNMKVTLQCESTNTSPAKYEVFITLKEVNEFAPNFTQRVYYKTIAENARIGDTVFLASSVASDQDYEDRLIFETANFPQGKDRLDGIASGKFKMTDYKTGLIVVNGHLDYEEQNKYNIKMIVKDSGSNQVSAKLIINITDVDEFGPSFLPNPCATGDVLCQIPVLYHAQIKAADKGQISIFPNEVKSVDMEANNYTIGYSFSKGNPPNIVRYFKIDSRTAAITKVEDLPKNVTSAVTLFIKAEEQSALKHSSFAILIIDILDRNSTVAMSTQTPNSFSDSMIEGYSADVFYGVLITLAVIVGALVLCIVVIVIKSRKAQLSSSMDNLKANSNKPVGASVIIQTTNSLLSRKSLKGIGGSREETAENGFINHAFVPDTLPKTGGDGGDDKMSATSTEDNDVHPRSSHGDHKTNEYENINLSYSGIYLAIEDLRKAGIDEEETANDGDIGNNDSTGTNSINGTDHSTSGVSETHNAFPEELHENESDTATKTSSGVIKDVSLELVPEIPAPDYILDDAQSQCESKESTWAVPETNGQLESEISEFLLTPDFIENVNEKPASSESLSKGISLQTEEPLKSTGTTDEGDSDSVSVPNKESKTDADEDNTLPEWASEALQPTICPISSREQFKSHLESLISSPPQMPQSKTLPSPSTQSPVATPKENASSPTPTQPPPPPPPPPQLPSSSTVETPSTSVPSSTPPPPPPPPIQIMATHL